MRDQHAGCVGSYLIEHDLFDFLLLSLPDNDTHSHKNGPFAQVVSLAQADKQIERLMHAAGGPDAFLEDHAVIVCSDHSQSQVEQEIDLFRAFDGFAVQPASKVRARAVESEIAVCPASRSAQVYVLDPRAARRAGAAGGAHAAGARGRRPRDADDRPPRRRGRDPRQARRRDEGAALLAARRPRRPARGALASSRATSTCWRCRCARAGSTPRSTRTRSGAPGRRCAARTSGELLASAAPGFEFLDWGGAHHVGGGSHGALHANDSLGSLIWCGTGPPADCREQWSLRDIVPMIDEHFGVERG